MAGRGPQSFKKRQKEQARKEKQQDKAAKRVQRKVNKDDPNYVEGVDEVDDDLLLDADDGPSASEIADRLAGLRAD